MNECLFEPSQLDRIEQKLDQLLAKRKRKPQIKNDFIILKPEFVSDEMWEAYLKHRKQKKVAVTERSYNLLCKKLTKWHSEGHDVNAILEQSVENGWTGVFEVKKNESALQHISTPTHDKVDFGKMKEYEQSLDPVDPYADLK